MAATTETRPSEVRPQHTTASFEAEVQSIMKEILKGKHPLAVWIHTS